MGKKKKKKEVTINGKMVFGLWSLVAWATFFYAGGLVIGDFINEKLISVFAFMFIGLMWGILVVAMDKKERERKN